MKIGRLKNDLKWNIGFSFEDDTRMTIVRAFVVKHPKILKIWCFKQKELTKEGCQITKNKIGFYYYWNI